MLSTLSFALFEFVMLAMIFTAIGICFHGLAGLRTDDRIIRDGRVNLAFLVSDLLIVAPPLGAMAFAVEEGLRSLGVDGFLALQIGSMPFWLQAVFACLVIDFIGYWRHRIMHWGPLWPIHSVHHSDETVTWLTLARFHPLNRLISNLLLIVCMALLGFPKAAVGVGVLVVHYYGYFLHADVPWRYGVLKFVFVSPVMHRWHHSYAEDVRDKNFSVLFSAYDVAFGTFVVPDRPLELVGVGDDSYPQTWLGQVIHPFKVWLTSPRSPEPTAGGSAPGARVS